MNKIQSFTDLRAWKEAHQLVLMIYNVTKDFPLGERFGLTEQIRRASVSISSNIAEGFSRYSRQEKKHFYYLALGSLTELQNQLLVARDVHYLPKESFNKTAQKSIDVSKLINSLIKYLNNS